MKMFFAAVALTISTASFALETSPCERPGMAGSEPDIRTLRDCIEQLSEEIYALHEAQQFGLANKKLRDDVKFCILAEAISALRPEPTKSLALLRHAFCQPAPQ
jgi:hypothetical protein